MMKYKFILSILIINFFVLKVTAQEQFLYVRAKNSHIDYRIRFDKTIVTVETNELNDNIFKDKIYKADTNGILFERNGYYKYADIKHIDFKHYNTSRALFQRTYYVLAFNTAVFLVYYSTLHYSQGAFSESIEILTFTSPFWAIGVPQIINLGIIAVSPQVFIEVKNADFKISGRNSPFNSKIYGKP